MEYYNLKLYVIAWYHKYVLQEITPEIQSQQNIALIKPTHMSFLS